MPRKYLRQELEIRAGEKEIYVYNKHGDYIRLIIEAILQGWVIIPTDMPADTKTTAIGMFLIFSRKHLLSVQAHVL